MRRGSALNRNIDRWLGIPLLRAAAAARRRATMPPRDTVRRVGVLTSTTMGDTLLASAAIQRLRAIWPQSEIVFFAANGNRGAAELLPAIDRIEPLSLTRPWQTIAAMRKQGLDVLVDFSAWQRVTALICALSGSRFRAGFRRAAQHRHFALDLAVEHRNDRHESENFSALADALEHSAHAPHTGAGLKLRDGVLETPIDPRWHGAVVFHCWATGANAHLREWPQDRWAELAAQLRERWPDLQLVLTAGPSDMAQAQELAPNLNAEIFRGGIAEVAALLSQSTLVISVNTGIMHLASIVGATTIGLSGPTSDMRWGPRGPRAKGIQANGPGCPYLDLGWEFPPLDKVPNCMSRIAVAEVLRYAPMNAAIRTAIPGI